MRGFFKYEQACFDVVGIQAEFQELISCEPVVGYSYDERGRIASETNDLSKLIPGLEPQGIALRFDALGRKAGIVYPDGTKVHYDYDVRGRLVSVDDGGKGQPIASYAYDPLGRIAQLTRDNDVATAYTYDMAGQLTDIAHTKGNKALASAHYELDVLGRRTAQTREDDIRESYTYDATSQLTGVDYGSRSSLASSPTPVTRETFAYDPTGNRTEVSRVIPNAPLARESYQTNALNQYTLLTSGPVAPVAFRYDSNGNLLQAPDSSHQGSFSTYTYDSLNRLIAMEGAVPSGPNIRAEFFYDARNRCVLRKYYTRGSQGQWTLNTADSRALTYDTSWNLLCERTLDGAQVGEYIHGQRTDEIIQANLKGQNSKLQSYFPLADGLGSTVALTNGNGKVTDRYRYTAYGQPTVLKSDYSPPALGSSLYNYRFLFTGREWLSSVQLNDHRNRYYSPELGRWLSTDPIGFGGGINLYRYAGNAATLYRDLFGLSCEKEKAAWESSEAAYDAAKAAAGVETQDLNRMLTTINNDLVAVGVGAATGATGAGLMIAGDATANPALVTAGTSMATGGLLAVVGGSIKAWYDSWGLEAQGAELKQARADVSSAWSAHVAAGDAYIACEAKQKPGCPSK